uniref:Retinoblastoma-associated protein A-box domain-containing protein n=1 Tax=Esox lucius TaxID=8010 RepID=A0A3P8XP87_ESOLU
MATLLQDLLSGSRHGPSDSLASTFRSCARNPSETISTRLRGMLDTFYQHYKEPGEENCYLDRERGVRFSHQAGALYYRVLEAVINQERLRLRAKDLSGILEHDLFQRSLVACCLEMVMFSHQPTDSFCFPLVIEIFSLAPYYFYKVIEPVLRAEEGLPPRVVRHLNDIEEQVLESLAWRRDSPLWENIRNTQEHVPACQQVMPPQYLEDTDKESKASANPSHPTPSCVSGPHGDRLNSPITLDDRYGSPPVGSDVVVGCATPVRPPPPPSVIVTAKTVVTVASATVTTNNGQSVTIPVQGLVNDRGGITLIPVHLSIVRQPVHLQQMSSASKQQPQASVPNKPQRGGSLSLFLRKVYHLASRRLRDICVKLGICEELRLKIWTCFEYALVHCTDLMLDRHLDQILMCAIYIMTKVETPPLSPYPCQCIGAPRRFRPHNHHSLYISSYKPSTPPSTPHSPCPGVLYYISRSPSERLQEINNMIRTGVSSTKRGRTQHEEGEEDCGPLVKRPCQKRPSAWQRRLRDMVNVQARSRAQNQQHAQSSAKAQH